ncbi:hypothetical protein P3L10_023568 [Capsicum annuum]
MLQFVALDGFRRSRGRPKKYWREVIRHDMELLQLTEDMTLYRKVWRSRIGVEVAPSEPEVDSDKFISRTEISQQDQNLSSSKSSSVASSKKSAGKSRGSH